MWIYNASCKGLVGDTCDAWADVRLTCQGGLPCSTSPSCCCCCRGQKTAGISDISRQAAAAPECTAEKQPGKEVHAVYFKCTDCVRLSLLWLTCPQPSFTFVTFARLIYLKANWSGNQSIQFDHHWLTQIPSCKNLHIKSRIWNRICCQECSLLNGLLNSARKPMKYFGPANFVIHSFASIQSKLCKFSFWAYQSPKLSAKMKRWYDPGINLQ